MVESINNTNKVKKKYKISTLEVLVRFGFLLVFIASFGVECYAQYKLNTHLFAIARLLIVPSLLLSTVNLETNFSYRQYFYYGMIATFLADGLTIKYNTYFFIGIASYAISWLLIGFGLYNLRTNKGYKFLGYIYITAAAIICFVVGVQLLTNSKAALYMMLSVFALVGIYMINQAFVLRKTKKKLADKYYIPMAICAILSFLCYMLSFWKPLRVIEVAPIFFNGVFFFLLAMGTKLIDEKKTINFTVNKPVAIKANQE